MSWLHRVGLGDEAVERQVHKLMGNAVSRPRRFEISHIQLAV